MENYTNSYYFYANYSNDRNFKDTHTLDTFPYYSNLILTFEKWRVNIDPVSPSYHLIISHIICISKNIYINFRSTYYYVF